MKASTPFARSQRGLDQTGIATARCRHAFLLSAVSMTSGEKFAYALAMLSVLKKLARNLCRLWYDVGDRRFESALLNYPELAGIQPMLPRLHAHMHARRCHLLYNGLTFTSAGLPNSELSEQENRWLGLVRRFHSVEFY